MVELVNTLNSRYTAVIQSETDSLFYQNIHAYVDLIIKTPIFYSVIKKAQHELAEKQHELWNHSPELSSAEKSQLSLKNERFNLYTADYCVLEMRIYWPIEEYKTTNDTDSKQDPLALYLLKGKDYTKRIRKNAFRKDNLDSYDKWFKGKRKEYENAIKQFHVDFLSALQKQPKEETVVKPALPIFLSESTGDFKYYSHTGNFVPTGQEFKVLKTLLNSENYTASYLTLYQSFNPHRQEISKAHKPEISQIIKKIKQRLLILPKAKATNPDFIKGIPNKGYRLVFKEKPQ